MNCNTYPIYKTESKVLENFICSVSLSVYYIIYYTGLCSIEFISPGLEGDLQNFSESTATTDPF